MVVKADGSIITRGEKEMVNAAINARLNKFKTEDGECTSRFVKDVTFEEGYYIKSELDGQIAVEGVVNSLDVITEIRKTTDVMVPYKSTTQKTNEQVVGYSKVTVAGVSGVNRVTQDIVMLNGEVQSSTDVSNEVVVAPVNEVIVKGTAKTLSSAKQKQQAHAAGFIFPLPSGTWRVSSYYGDGRNHKGVDLCAKSGTSIFAALDGKVIHAGWKGAYGYCVIIEHSNGMRTLYAHAKQVCCSVGDMVSQGEVIALVGTTGQSTGNHLHFEVIVNGRHMDPAPHINLDK
jgi:murein DD-endopeptidase MepM/ murein hydrolase activator NlpD